MYKDLSVVRSMTDKCLLDQAATLAGSLDIEGLVFQAEVL
jgi:hypothetical protein